MADSSGFGGAGSGGGPWGDGFSDLPVEVFAEDSVSVTDGVQLLLPLGVSYAQSQGPHKVLVVFNRDLNLSYAPLTDPDNYTIDPILTVTGVTTVGSNAVMLTVTPAQGKFLYTVTVTAAQDSNGGFLGIYNYATFLGISLHTTFVANAISATRVAVVYANPMTVDFALTAVSNYKINAVLGSAQVLVGNAVTFGQTPIQRVLLTLTTPLISGQYYALTISQLVSDSQGGTVNPDTAIFQWVQTPLVFETPLSEFTGEHQGGLLGTPNGQVYFSPALDYVPNSSVIEVEEIDVSTRAYDEYQIPSPVDPEPIRTFDPNQPRTTLNTNVFFATAERLGVARWNLTNRHSDSKAVATDSRALATLSDAIDTTKAGFLNDTRWETFPATGHTVFSTAQNGSPIGPGGTTNYTLEP